MSHIIQLSDMKKNNITELDDNYKKVNINYNNNVNNNFNNKVLKQLDRDIKINNLLLGCLNIIIFIGGCGLLSLIVIIIILMFI